MKRGKCDERADALYGIAEYFLHSVNDQKAHGESLLNTSVVKEGSMSTAIFRPLDILDAEKPGSYMTSAIIY